MPSIKEMKATITRAGLPTADLLERADVEARYGQAQSRLAEAERLRASRAPTPPPNPVSTYYVTLAFSKILASKSLIFPGSGAIGSQLRSLLCKPAEVAQNNLGAAALALHCGAASA